MRRQTLDDLQGEFGPVSSSEDGVLGLEIAADDIERLARLVEVA